jgi:hypothetical protein
LRHCGSIRPRAFAALKITNANLVATCFDGKPIANRERSWHVTAPVTLTLTMRNEPRPGIANAAPGLAALTFTPEDGHRYEVEVQAPATANSQRVWSRGEWTPVVRDRTTDQVVTGQPQWVESGCRP